MNYYFHPCPPLPTTFLWGVINLHFSLVSIIENFNFRFTWYILCIYVILQFLKKEAILYGRLHQWPLIWLLSKGRNNRVCNKNECSEARVRARIAYCLLVMVRKEFEVVTMFVILQNCGALLLGGIKRNIEVEWESQSYWKLWRFSKIFLEFSRKIPKCHYKLCHEDEWNSMVVKTHIEWNIALICCTKLLRCWCKSANE